MIKKQLTYLTHYNIWANTKIFDFIEAAGEGKSDLIQQSSFPTIRKTLYHIYDAEAIWIHRLKGEIPVWPASAKFSGTLHEFGKVFIECSKSFAAYTEKLSDTDFEKVSVYKNTKGDEFKNRIADIITHVMNHSTYHRGQLITMLRGTGYTNVTSTDFITYCRL